MRTEISGAALLIGLMVAGVPHLDAATYQAEDAALSGGTVVATDHTGYAGTGFVGGYTDANKGTAATTFSVGAASTGAYALAVRYANGTGATMTLGLYVDGARLRQVGLAPTTDWDSWGIATEAIALGAGAHTVAYRFDTSDSGNVNIDQLDVAPTTPIPDLIVTDLTWTPSTPSVGQAVSFTATMANQGTGATPAGVIHGVGFSVDGAVVNWAAGFSGSIPPGGSVTVTADGGFQGSTWPATAGPHTVLANVDDVNRIAESNEGNNTLSRTLTVAGVALPDGLYRIRNNWQWNQYLYETAGFVAYGTPVATDKSSQWALVAQGSNVLLWNAATGNYMTMAEVFSAGDPVRTSYTDTSAAAQWVVIPASNAGFFTVQSVAQPAWYVNLEGLAGFIQCFGIPPFWGSPQWAFERVGDLPARPAATATPTPAPMPNVDRYGAQVPFTTYEAEDARQVRTNGTVLAARRSWGQLTSEASGRRAVQLTAAGQYVELKLEAPAQGVVIRYSIPDSSTGASYDAGLSLYVGGVRKHDVTLTNKFIWLYGTWLTEPGQVRWSNNPSAVPTNPHRFFDEVAIKLDRAYPAGTSLRLVRETSNAGFASTPAITIDLVETESIPAAAHQPSGYVSITRYGAAANDGIDDTAALHAAIGAVKSSGGGLKGVWIPEGAFDLESGVAGAAWDGSGTRVYLDSGVSLRGAGMWRSVLQGRFAGLYARGGNVTIADLKIAAADVIRDDYNGVSGLEGDLSRSFVTNVWFEHGKVGIWATNRTNALLIAGCRIRDVWADGLNLHYGTTHALVADNHVRNTGDDGLAMWSDTFLDTENAFIKNTVQIPNLANGIGIYGGQNNRVQGNLVADTVDNGAGISFGTNFNPPSLTGTLTISNNALVRTGTWHHDFGYALGALWGYWAGSAGRLGNPTVTVSSNLIWDSRYSGVLIEEPSIGANVGYSSNWIGSSGTYGVQIRWTAAGTTAFNNNNVIGAPLGRFVNQSSNMMTTGSGNNW